MLSLVLLWLWWITCGLAGIAIGKGFRNQPFAGFVLGVLLGPLGWLIILGLHDWRCLCPHCGDSAIPGASVCRHCGSQINPKA